MAVELTAWHKSSPEPTLIANGDGGDLEIEVTKSEASDAGGTDNPVYVDVHEDSHVNSITSPVSFKNVQSPATEPASTSIRMPRGDAQAAGADIGLERLDSADSRTEGKFKRMRSLPSEYIKELKSLPKVKVGGDRRGSEDGLQANQPGSSGKYIKRVHNAPGGGIKRILYPSSDNSVKNFYGSSANLYKETDRRNSCDSWVIHPFSMFRMAWTVFMISILAITVVVLPVSIAYFYEDRSSGWLIFNAICDSFFLIDIILSFRTGFINERENVVVLESKAIARKYASTWFILDIIGLMPIDYIFIGIHYTINSKINDSDGRPIRVVRVAKLLELFKLLRVTRLFQQTAVLSKLFNVAGAVFGAIRLLLVALMMSHWGACLIVFVPAVQDFPSDSWVYLQGLQNGTWYEQHFNAWLKTLSFMCGVGYGLITPINMTDIWLSILLMLLLASTYIMLVGYFSAIVMSYDVAGKTYQSFMQEVDEFMVYRKFPMQLRSKIYDYFDYRYRGKMYEEDEVIDELSAPLRQEVVHHIRRDLILNVPIFSNADPSFVHEVVAVLNYEYFQPGDLIIKVGFSATKMYFIEKGSVEIYSREGVLVTRVKQGSYFGEIALMTGCPRTATVRARSYLKLYSLAKDDFDPIIEKHPTIYRAMALIAIKRMESLGEGFPEEHMRLIDIITKQAANPAKGKKPKKSPAHDSNGNKQN